MTRRGFSIVELEVAVLLATFAALTLASLLAQQIRVVERLSGMFSGEQVIHLSVAADPVQRQLRLPARITIDQAEPWPALLEIPVGDITVITVVASGEAISVIADLSPSEDEQGENAQ